MVNETQKGEQRSEQERPEVHVTRFGGRYVKADELLRSKRGREVIDAIAEFDFGDVHSVNRPAGD